MDAIEMDAIKGIQVLAIVCIGFMIGCESRPAYHLRQLRWHGHESKDGDEQERHGKELVKCGASAVPLLIDELRLFRYNKSRYSPSSIQLLQRIGDPAITRLQHEIDRLIVAKPGSEEHLVEQRLVLIATLVLISENLDYFDQWLADAEDPSVDWHLAHGHRPGFLFRLEGYFANRFPEATAFLKETTDDSPSPVSDKFKLWWKAATRGKTGSHAS